MMTRIDRRRRRKSRNASAQRKHGHSHGIRPRSFEPLEDRLLLVVSAIDLDPGPDIGAAPVPPGTGFDGVVNLGGCTGTLLSTGQHVLTAAHCFTDDDTGAVTASSSNVTFNMPSADFTQNVPAADFVIPAGWGGFNNDDRDIAVLPLPFIAPFGAERRDINTGTSELNDTITIIGYGNTGTGTLGELAGTGGTKRIGFNQVGQITGNSLRFDFDMADGSTDTLGDGAGLGDNLEAIQGRGDSGGGTLLNSDGDVAGVLSGNIGGFFFGGVGDATRVSDFVTFINTALGDPIPFVVDMQEQEAGDDGTPDQLRFVLNGADLELYHNGILVNVKSFASVSEIIVAGSSDDDTLVIDFSGGDPIPAGGVDYDGRSEGSTGDNLVVQGGSLNSVVYNATGSGEGDLDLDGSTITFTGLEPILVTSGIGTLEINVTDGLGHEIVLQNAIGVQQSEVTIDGGLEDMAFSNPASLLTINAGAGDDKITVDSVDVNFVADIVLNGDEGDDLIVINGPDHLVQEGAPTIFANGHTGDDTFKVIASETFFIEIDGGPPVFGDPDVPPGDVLALETLDVVNPVVTHSQITGSGGMTSSDHLPVSWESIETLIVPDEFELNETIETATVLGSLQKITLRDLSIHRMGNNPESFQLDVFLLFDDTGSFAGVAPTLTSAFPNIISNLQTQLPGIDLAFGVGRFEEYANFASEDPDGRPFILNQPIVETTTPGFLAAINAALARTAPGFGGDGPETAIEALFQLATGAGYDGNNDGTTTESGPAGLISTQVSPGSSGDVPAFSTFMTDTNVLAPAGTLGGAGFRSGALPLVLLATDTGFAFEPDGVDPYTGAGGVTVPAADVQFDGRDTTPFGTGASIQATINALTALGVQVIGLGTNTSAASAPRRNLEAVSSLTGAVNNSTTVLDSGIPADPISTNDPLYFVIDTDSADNVADAIVTAVSAAANFVPIEDDVDVFKYTAQDTGKLIVNALFDHDIGDLNMFIRDMDGNILASSTSVTDNERITIPVVSQEMYFIEVVGFQGAVNNYDLEIENFPAPVPSGVELDPASDTGMMNDDNVTADDTPRIIIQADVGNFVDTDGDGIDEISILTPAQATAGDTPGAAVQVFITNANTGVPTNGYANRIGTSKTLFEFTPTSPLGDGVYIVSAAVKIFDGRQDPDPAMGRSDLSEPLRITIDTVAPAVSDPDLLASSDTGMFDTDDVTGKMRPAFSGTAEANAKIRVLADGVVVGQGVATTAGAWEVTVEPLDDGTYTISVQAEDLAGNVSQAGQLTVWIDATEPNTPLLDLVTDTGHSDKDNITNDNTPTVTVTADDTVDGDGNPFPHEIKYRIYDRPGNAGTNGEVLLVDSVVTQGGLSTNGFFVEVLPLLADGVHNLKLEVEDRAGNLSHDFLLEIVIDTTVPEAFPPDLIDSSDTGMDDQDNVTNKMEPAFNGVAEAGAIVRVYATNVVTGVEQLVGEGEVGGDLSDVSIGGVGGVGGEPDDGLGLWEVTVEPLADAVYEITVEFEDWAGNVSPRSEPLIIEVDTLAPNTPLLDLVAASDTGRHDDDNVTNDETPTFTMTSTDPNQAAHVFAENYKFRVFDRDEGTPTEVLIYDSFAEFGDFTASELLTRTVADPPWTVDTLDEGVHNLKLEVEDRAGNISHDFLLQITVDVTPPPVTITGIDPAQTDTGVAGQPDTFADRITSDTMTGFVGTAEADAIVRMWADGEEISGGMIDASDVFQGLTVAVPLDGNKAFPGGMWRLAGQFDLNDPSVGFPLDGVRQIAVTAEDLAGNVNLVGDEADEQQILDIFIDTQGPRVAAVNDPDGESVFDPKPTDGPSPLMHFLDILFTDEPIRVGESIIVGDDAVFVIDVSGSTTSPFGGTSVGDLNGDGNPDTILDAEIAAFIALNQQLIALGLGDVSNVSVVPFSSGATALDMDPVAPDVQLSTTPNADADANGTPDVEDVLRSLNSGGGTNFETALQEAIATIGAVGTAPANGNVVFLSDGFGSGDFADEVATLLGIPINLRAFGVGTGSDLSQLLTMDPMAMQFTSTDELLGVFGGGGNGGGTGSGFVYPAVNEILATTPGNYQLVGDSTGQVLITQVTFLDMTVSGDIGRTTVRLHFAEPLPDDRYTLTVFDRIQDDAGNALDGDVQASSPGVDVQLLPSGDGVPGGNFVGRFTVDSRPEIGTYAHFNVYLDINGNFTFDPTNIDAVNRDLVFKFPLTQFGVTAEAIFAGNFSPAGAAAASGFDKLGAYGKIDNKFRWLLDFDHDGVIDLNVVSGLQINGLPVAGDFNAAHPGDEIGLFDGTTWYLDTNGNNNIDGGDAVISGNLRGFPIVGDFDGDGLDDLATWQDDRFRFNLAADGLTGNTGHTIDFGFPGVLERPVAADMNQDGIDDIGLYVPKRDGVLPRDQAEWYFLISDRPFVDEGASGVGTVDALDHPFEPVPFGTDLFAQFGDDLAIPIVGNFDPPTASGGALDATTSDTVPVVFRNGLWLVDADGAGGVAEDAFSFGVGSDRPVMGDWNRDGADEAAVVRNGVWYFDLDGAGGLAEARFAFGIPGDVPVSGDFNGDGLTDAGLFRNGMWYFDLDGAGRAAEKAFAFGIPGDKPVTGDFNGDGTTDVGVYRNGVWYLDLAGDGRTAEQKLVFGIPGDKPVTGDFNGDGTTNIAVVRNNMWYFDLDGAGRAAERSLSYGMGSDVPLAARIRPAISPENGGGGMSGTGDATAPNMTFTSLSTTSGSGEQDPALVDQALEDLIAPSTPQAPAASIDDGPLLHESEVVEPNQDDSATINDDDLAQALSEALDELAIS